MIKEGRERTDLWGDEGVWIMGRRKMRRKWEEMGEKAIEEEGE